MRDGRPLPEVGAVTPTCRPCSRGDLPRVSASRPRARPPRRNAHERARPRRRRIGATRRGPGRSGPPTCRSASSLFLTRRVRAAGVRDGQSVYHIGWQTQRLRQSMSSGADTGDVHRPDNAMRRMIAEAAQSGPTAWSAPARVPPARGQRRTHRVHRGRHGRVVQGQSRRITPARRCAILRHLNVQDFYTLLRTGHTPWSSCLAFACGTWRRRESCRRCARWAERRDAAMDPGILRRSRDCASPNAVRG